MNEKGKYIITPGKWYTEFDENGSVINDVYDISYYRLLGFNSREEYASVCHKWEDTIHPDDIDMLKAYNRDITSKHPEGMDYDIEYRMMTKYGYHWFHDSGHVIRRDDGSIIRCDGAIFDIQDCVDREKNYGQSVSIANYFINTASAAYYCDLTDGTVKILQDRDIHTGGLEERNTDLEHGLLNHIREFVHPDDIRNVLEKLSIQGIRRGLDSASSYDFSFREVYNGTEAIFRGTVMRGEDSDHAVICIINITGEFRRELEQTEMENAHRILNDNITRVLALNDEFESLYDVNLETGRYETYIKGQTFNDSINSLMVNNGDFFADVAVNVNRVLYPEDRDEVIRVVERDYIRGELENKSHFDWYYRINVNENTVWFRMRILYKDAEKKNIIVGVFNAASEMSSKQKEKQLRESLISKMAGGESLYIVRPGSNSYQVLHRNRYLTEKYGKGEGYAESIGRYINSDVDGAFRDLLRSLTSAARLTEVLNGGEDYSEKFLDISEDSPKWYQMRVARLSDEEILLSFTDVDSIVRQQQENERFQKLISGITGSYNIVYSVNMADDSLRILRMDDNMLEKSGHFNTFTEAWKYSLDNVIHPRDRKRMAHELDYSTIRSKLSQTTSYSTVYNIIKYGATLYGEMKITAVDEDRIIVGLAENDLELTKRQLAEKRYDEYFALFVVDIDTEMFRVLKTSPWYKTDESVPAAPYTPSLQAFASKLEGEAKDFFMKISDLSYIRNELAKEDKHTYYYKSNIIGDNKWVDVTSYVTLRHEDGTPAMFTLGFSLADSLGTSSHELQSRMKSDMQVIGGLASGYLALYFINIDEGLLRVYSLNGERIPDTKQLISRGGSSVDMFRQFGSSDAVHPDDRHLFAEIDMETLRERLAHRKKFTVRFRRNYGGTYLWSEMDVVKCEGVDEQANAVVIGFAERDEEIRKERELQDKLALRSAISDYFINSYTTAYYCNINDGSVLILHMDSEIDNDFQKKITTYNDSLRVYIENDVHPDDREMFYAYINPEYVRSQLKKSDSISFDFRDISEDSPAIYRCTIIPGEDDDHIGMAFRDITETVKRQNEQQEKIRQAEESEKLIESFTERFSTVLLIDRDGSYSIVKKQDNTQFRVPENLPFDSLAKQFASDAVYQFDRESFLRECSTERIHERSSKEKSYAVEFRMRGGSDGVRYWCEMRVNAVSEQKTLLAIRNRDNDIIHRLVDEKLYNEYASIFLVDIDTNTFRFLSRNRDSGLDDMPGGVYSEVIKEYISRVNPDYRESWYKVCDVEKIRTRLTAENRMEYTYPLEGAEKRWRRCIIQTLDSENGIPSTFIMTFITIDDTRAAAYELSAQVAKQKEKLEEQQRQLEEALSMAQSASRAKTTFLNNMSHDIRTPMNAIIGFTGLAASHIDNKEQVRDYLSKISQSSDHLLSLINDVLDMSRIESGKMNLNEKEESLPDIIHTLRDIVQADVHSKQHDFFIDTVNINDENIICDKLRLNQVLLNILSNSIKYTAPGGTISMRITEKTVKPSGYATYEFVIKDNGMGMDSEYLKTIFDPFTRVKSTTVSGIQGTGLGMAITKNIIDMMGGKIDVKSEIGKGTQMTVTFDFRLQNNHREPQEISELKGLRGLVTDDDANTCLSVYTMLRDIGVRAEWCTSGKEAVFRAEAAYREGDLFKIYIIDWLMPDMNGIETARRIRRSLGDDAAIIILTAYDWSDLEDEAKEAGVTSIVSKPLFPSDLHKVLSDCFKKAAAKTSDNKTDYRFNGKKVLLVEDNELNREIASEILEEDGFEVFEAEDGDIAVEKMEHAAPGDYDIVLMDIQMPTIDGYETTKRIRAMGTEISRIPIIAMTANAFEEDRRLALESGMNEHIAKPIDINKLRETLSKFL